MGITGGQFFWFMGGCDACKMIIINVLWILLLWYIKGMDF